MDLIVTPDHKGGWHARQDDQLYACALGRNGAVPAAEKREGDGASPLGHWHVQRVLYRPDRGAPPDCLFSRQEIRACRRTATTINRWRFPIGQATKFYGAMTGSMTCWLSSTTTAIRRFPAVAARSSCIAPNPVIRPPPAAWRWPGPTWRRCSSGSSSATRWSFPKRRPARVRSTEKDPSDASTLSIRG